MRKEAVWSDDFNTNLNFDVRFSAGLVAAPVSLEVLHPTHDEQSSLLGTSTNEASGVIRMIYTFLDGDTRTVLLTGIYNSLECPASFTVSKRPMISCVATS